MIPTRMLIVVIAFGCLAALLFANLGPARKPPGQSAQAIPSALPDPLRQAPATSTPAQIQQGLGEVVAAIRPAVVSISAHPDAVAHPAHAGMQLLEPFHARPSTWVGSGILVHPEGYILTCRQVTRDADRVQVTLFRSGQNTVMAHRVATDASTGLVLLKLPLGRALPYALLADSSRVRSGDLVMALGSPFGLAKTVTQGIVSTSRRSLSVSGQQLTDVIQTDAAINQGNCGGPLVNIRARVIGINIAIFSTDSTFSGIGFAIPSNQARAFLRRALGLGR